MSRLSRIAVGDFRNIRLETLDFDKRINIFHGENAQGKTNFIEAIHLISNLRSFRTRRLGDLIRRGEVHEIKDLMKRSQEQGMVTFDQALVQLFLEEKITYENALRFADSSNDVRLMIKLSGKGGAFGDGGFQLNEEEMDDGLGPFKG